MAKLSIVRPQLTEDEVRSEIKAAGGKISVAKLMHKSGFSRAVVRRLVSECKGAPKAPIKPPVRPKPNPVPIAPTVLKPPAPVPAKPRRSPLIGWGFGVGGVALGAAGMVMNYRFAYSFGQDAVSSNVLGLLGVAIDWAALLLLPGADALREQRRYVLCGAALLSWLPFLTLSTVAAMGFAGGNIGDGLQARDTVVRHREGLEAELAAAKLERWKIVENRDPLILEQQIQIAQGKVPFANWKSSNRCTDVSVSGAFCEEIIRLREAKVTAERRIRLDDRIHDLSEATAKLPQIAVKDPAADQIAQMTFGLVAAEQVGNYRVRGLAIVPGFASILLAFARALLR